MSAVHASPYSGTWYPGSPVELERLLEERFEESRRRTGPYLFPGGLGFVVPHAAPEYSGAVAASVYRSLREQNPERIILLAFPHRGGLRGVAAPDTRAIRTPLGSVPTACLRSGRFPRVSERLVCDHSFEIQLPFLQKAVPHAQICPLYVGRSDESERQLIAESLAKEWRPGSVFVASSDFTHYGRSFGYIPFPVDDLINERLRALDEECIEAAGSIDPSLFLDVLAQTGATVCGSDPIALLLSVLALVGGHGVYQLALDRQTSGEILGDFDNTVSYAALAYFPRSSFELSPADGASLMASAEITLRRLRETGDHEPEPARGSIALESQRGIFVSLHRGSQLLGCMGHCEGRLRLTDAVPELALAAALEDPRFRPGEAVRSDFDVEISVLTPLRRIRNAAGFQVGRHGGVLRLGTMSGLLLPQVAAGRHWTSTDFLEALSEKGGLPACAYLDPAARLYVFEVQVLRGQKATAIDPTLC